MLERVPLALWGGVPFSKIQVQISALVTYTPPSRGGGVFLPKPEIKFRGSFSRGALGKGVVPSGVWVYWDVVLEAGESVG